MKTTIAMLLLAVAASTHAEKYFELRNKAGGKITILQNDCKGREPLKMMTASTPNGVTLFGCWGYFGGEVHVLYEDGERRAYPPDVFTFIDTDPKK
mgnify:CR=1 FL=1